MGGFSLRYDLAVVGGGLGGLTAATLAAMSGRRVVLYERATGLGGRARSQALTAEHTVNLGPHAIYRGGPALKVLRALGVDAPGGVNRGEGAMGFREGRLHTLPSGPVSLLTTGLLRLPGRLELMRLLSGIGRVDVSVLMQVPLAEWLRDTLRERDARELASAIFRLSTYCADAERLSAGSAIEQLRIGLKGVIYVDGGWQTLVDAVEQKAREAGVTIVSGSRVEAVTPQRHDEPLCELRLAEGRTERARAVILAVDPEAAARLLDPERGLGIAERLARLVPVRAACLDVALRRLPRSRHLVALGVGQPLYAAVHSHWARLAEGEGAVVQLAKYLDVSKESAADAEAELEVVLDALQPDWRRELVSRRFLPNMTVMHALPTAALGGTAGRPAVEVTEAPGIYLCGDWVGPTGMLLDAVLSSASAAVEGSATRVVA